MTARILVVDDIPENVKLLEARLVAEYFEVLTAENGQQALDVCDRTQVDLILLDIMMPGMDGFEVCERLKANPRTSHIPVVMVTALDQPTDRVRGLKAGADDFLTKPVNDLKLISRVQSLLRLNNQMDELTNVSANVSASKLTDASPMEPGQILLVDGRGNSQERIIRALKPIADVSAISDPQAALFEAAAHPFELVIVNSNFDDYDPLRLCSQLRSLARTRFLPVLLITEEDEDDMIVRALDLGVNDYIVRPVDPNELVARSLTQIRRKRLIDRLRTPISDRQTDEKRSATGHTSPIKFEFTGGQLSIRTQNELPDDADTASVDIAWRALDTTGDQLLNEMRTSNCDRRLVEEYETLIQHVHRRSDIVFLGLTQITCEAITSSYFDELPSVIVGRSSAYHVQLRMYLRQFPDWKRFINNASSVDLTALEAESLQSGANKLVTSFKDAPTLVAPEVPAAIIEIARPLSLEKGAAPKAKVALLSVVAELAHTAVAFLKDFGAGTAKTASKATQRGIGIFIAAAILHSFAAHVGLVSKIWPELGLQSAIEALDKIVKALPKSD